MGEYQACTGEYLAVAEVGADPEARTGHRKMGSQAPPKHSILISICAKYHRPHHTAVDSMPFQAGKRTIERLKMAQNGAEMLVHRHRLAVRPDPHAVCHHLGVPERGPAVRLALGDEVGPAPSAPRHHKDRAAGNRVAERQRRPAVGNRR